MWVTVFPASAPPVTATGTLLLVVVPFPSCPCSLRPQQATVPSCVNAHEYSLPIEIWVPASPASERTVISSGVDVVAGLNAFHVEPLSEEYS